MGVSRRNVICTVLYAIYEIYEIFWPHTTHNLCSVHLSSPRDRERTRMLAAFVKGPNACKPSF